MDTGPGTCRREVDMDYILYEQKGQYAILTINREKALNALNSQVLDELNDALDAVNMDEVRCLILTGAGQKSFVAGADIGEMSTLTKTEGEAFGKKGNDVFRKLETFPIPVIAAVNGFALGGGCEISMSCDSQLFGQCGVRTAGGGPGHHARFWRDPEACPSGGPGHGQADDLYGPQYQGPGGIPHRTGERGVLRRDGR